MAKEISNRYIALDVLRGMTIAGMILVNNPGSWAKIFSPLRHAAWHGATPTDLVFPFFLFIVGAALSFSFAKYGGSATPSSVKKIIKRSALIFLTGLLLNAFPFYNTAPDSALSFGENWLIYISNLRIFGVLQRIAICYLIGALLALYLKETKKIIWAAFALMGLHLLVLTLFGGAEPFSKEGNISGAIDVALVGVNHVYKGFGLPFDPEGLLGALSGSATLLFGYLIGGAIQRKSQKIEVVGELYTIGLLALGAGMILSIWVPINKPLWTPSYVLYCGGWSTILLAFFVYLIDIKGKERLFFPFRALGLNPLFAFVMAAIFAKTLGRIIKIGGISGSSWLYKNCCVALLGDNEYGSLLYALIYVTIFTAMAIWLYRKKIVIKL